MKVGILTVCLLFILLGAACNPADELVPTIPTEQRVETAIQVVPVSPTSTPVPSQVKEATPTPLATSAPGCPGSEINRIGQAIADEYDFASYDDVMTWFCAGAEFEDILVALQTEELTGEPAEELLAMLADGFTWEEIWLVVGLTD